MCDGVDHGSEHVQQLRFARALSTIGEQLGSTSDWSAMLEMILDVVMEATTATHGALFLIQNGQAASLVQRGYSMAEESILQQIPPSLTHGLLAQAYRTCRPARSNDTLSDPEALPMLAATRSQAVIPICVGGQVLGLLDLQAPYPYAFCGFDDAWLQTIGVFAALPIERWRYQQLDLHPSAVQAVPQHQLLFSARLAAVTELAAGVAHEINNPLTTILGYANLLLRDPGMPPAARDDLTQIVIEGQRIAALVGRFLHFAQPTSDGKRPLDIHEPLLEALGLLRGRLQESGAQIALDLPDAAPLVFGQPAQLEQVFLDLLQNALEAMSDSDQRRITIRVGQCGEWVRVAIADTGRGIRPELLMRVFEPGFTTKVDQGTSRGLGLGLYAAHTIVQAHRGKIDVTSHLCQGSTFTVYLPALSSAEGLAETPHRGSVRAPAL